MIIKHVPIKKSQQGSFARLVQYITSSQGKHERVGTVTVTNCYQPEPVDALLEVAAVQALNTRSKGEKNYHLVISFPANEQPEAKILQAIETRVCEVLGFGEHQRISAVHHDTNNLHIHVAINKIHPTKHTMHDPYYPYKKIAKVCAELELQYGLQLTNHATQTRGASHRADAKHNYTDGISLCEFVKQECLQELHQAKNWQTVHQVLAQHGLIIKIHANGLVITDTATKLNVKASSIARDLSKTQLEQRLGAFAEAAAKATEPSKSTYGQQRHSPLYIAYRTAQTAIKAERQASYADVRDSRQQALAHLLQKQKFKYAAIKLLSGNKYLLHVLIQQQFKKELAVINARHAMAKQKITQAPRTRWNDWVASEAKNGNVAAMTIVQTQASKQPEQQFRQQAQRAATKLGVTLDATKLQQLREYLGANHVKRRRDRTSPTSIISPIRRATDRAKSNIARYRSQSPSCRTDGMRHMSELDVVRFARGSEMLLSSDARSHVEHEGTQSIDPLRRNAHLAIKKKKGKVKL